MGAGSPDRVRYDSKSDRASCENLPSPPKPRNVYIEANQSEKVEFLWYRKMTSLPRVSEEIQRAYDLYENTKKSFVYLGAALSVTEWLLLKVWTVTMVMLFVPPVADLTYYLMSKVKIWDDFICHQLDFVEAKFRTLDTSFIYGPGGVIDRVILTARLCVRVTFFFPRFTWRILSACLNVFTQEVAESINLAVGICVPELPRRSTRKSQKKLQKSPGKKRKHEDVTENLPAYLVCTNYSEEADPDYEPNSDDDTEVTSASEISHDSDDDGLEVEDIVSLSESPQKYEEINKNVIDFPGVPSTNIIVS